MLVSYCASLSESPAVGRYLVVHCCTIRLSFEETGGRQTDRGRPGRAADDVDAKTLKRECKFKFYNKAGVEVDRKWVARLLMSPAGDASLWFANDLYKDALDDARGCVHFLQGLRLDAKRSPQGQWPSSRSL